MTLRLPVVLGVLFAFACIPLSAGENSDSQDQNASKYGLEIGQKAPEFSLVDADGNTQSLTQLLKNNKVAIVFFRSADW